MQRAGQRMGTEKVVETTMSVDRAIPEQQKKQESGSPSFPTRPLRPACASSSPSLSQALPLSFQPSCVLSHRHRRLSLRMRPLRLVWAEWEWQGAPEKQLSKTGPCQAANRNPMV